jgi:predicted nucleic acid-binding protein
VKKRNEKYHEDSVKLSKMTRTGRHEAFASALILIEVPSGLASSTSLSIERIYEIAVTLQQAFTLQIMSFEPYLEKTIQLFLQLRDVKRRHNIVSADFHHLATAIQEGCEIFVTTDERHLLAEDVRDALKGYINLVDPRTAMKLLV